MQKEISKVPYLVDAMRNWAMDCGYTPHLIVEADYPGVNLPLEKIAVEEGMVTLNVHDRAINGYEVADGWILFATRFSGKVHQVDLPVESVISLFVPEVMNNLVFREYKPESAHIDSSLENHETATKKSEPHLRLVQ